MGTFSRHYITCTYNFWGWSPTSNDGEATKMYLIYNKATKMLLTVNLKINMIIDNFLI